MKTLDNNFDRLKQSLIEKRIKAESNAQIKKAVNTNDYKDVSINTDIVTDTNTNTNENINVNTNVDVNVDTNTDINTDKNEIKSANNNTNTNDHRNADNNANNNVHSSVNNGVNNNVNINTNSFVNTTVNKFVIKSNTNEEALVRYTLYLKPDTINKISQFAEKLNLGKSELARKILEETLENIEII